MEEITINFGLIASEKFPDVARERALKDSLYIFPNDEVRLIGNRVLAALKETGATWVDGYLDLSNGEPTLVVKMMYPVSSEKADCAPPSVLKYSKYMRLYEVACEYAQDCVAVLEAAGTGVLVGANCSDWGCSFDKTKFITVGD